MAKSKSTKKFEKKHLKGTIERRKDFAKVKQRHRLNEKRKQRTEKNSKKDAENGSTDGEVPKALISDADMNQDAYFQQHLPILDTEKPKQGNGQKRKRTEMNGDDQEGSETSSTDEEELDDHQDQLNALAEKDPEFYKYLQENDSELLDFDTNNLSDLEDGSESDQEDGARATKKQKLQKEDDTFSSDVTPTLIKKWKSGLSEQFSIRSMRQVVLAFRAAAHSNDGSDQEYKYSIPDAEMYHEVLTLAFTQLPSALAHHVPYKESSTGKLRMSTDSTKFKTLSPLIKSHASSIQYLLGNLSDASTIRLSLQSLEPLLPYLLQFRKLLKITIKTVASIWCDNTSDETTRLTAFLLIRRLMTIGDAGLRETILKATYEGVVKGSRNTTAHTLSGINLMKNSAAELWAIDPKVGYTTGFTFIRQLAIHLRGTITKPTKDSYKVLYNWQFVHSLDFWSRVLSMHCNSLIEARNGKESQLRPLIYPVAQITLGTMRLIPTSAYFPLRFHLIRSLLRISHATGTYIPLSSALLEVLNSAEMRKSGKAATVKALDFECNIKAPTSLLKTRVYQDGVGEQVTELFSEFFVLWSKNIAFPELQLPVIVMLKRWLKTASVPGGNKNAKLNQSLLLLVQKSEANAKWIEERRNKINFSPKDRTEVDTFLRDIPVEETPLGAFVAGQRRLRDDRQKALHRGRLEEEQKRKSKTSEGDDEIMKLGK